MKKIAIIYSGAKYFGGVETYLLELFKNYDKSQAELTLVSLGEWELCQKIKEMNGEVVVFSGERARLRTVKDISDYLKKNDFSLIVSQGVVANFYARLVSLASEIPSLVAVHSDLVSEYSNLFKRQVYLFSDFLLRPVTKKFVAVSGYLKSVLVKRGVNPDDIAVIYNGVEPVPGRRLKPQTGNCRITSVGRLHFVKGFDILVDAITRLPDKGIELVIWGGGDEKDNLHQQMAATGRLNVCLGGSFARSDLEKVFSATDIYVQPSRAEGFGLTVVEAMSAGLPVVVTPAGALPEIVKHGETGLVAKDMSPASLAEAIEKLAGDRELRLKMGRRAAEYVLENFGIQKWAEATIEEYLRAAK